jgi:hypothetical protein
MTAIVPDGHLVPVEFLKGRQLPEAVKIIVEDRDSHISDFLSLSHPAEDFQQADISECPDDEPQTIGQKPFADHDADVFGRVVATGLPEQYIVDGIDVE